MLVPVLVFLCWLPGYLFVLALLICFLVAWLFLLCFLSVFLLVSCRLYARFFVCLLAAWLSFTWCPRSRGARVRSVAYRETAIYCICPRPLGTEMLKQQCSRLVWSTGLIKHVQKMYYKLETTCYLYAWGQSLRCQLLHPHGCLRGLKTVSFSSTAVRLLQVAAGASLLQGCSASRGGTAAGLLQDCYRTHGGLLRARCRTAAEILPKKNSDPAAATFPVPTYQRQSLGAH
jgi:hypothetical protein